METEGTQPQCSLTATQSGVIHLHEVRQRQIPAQRPHGELGGTLPPHRRRQSPDQLSYCRQTGGGGAQADVVAWLGRQKRHSWSAPKMFAGQSLHKSIAPHL